MESFHDKRAWDAIVKQIYMDNVPKLLKPKKQKIKKIKISEVYEKSKELKLKTLYKIKGNNVLDIEGDPVRTINFELFSRLLKRCGNGHLIKKYELYDRMFDQDMMSNLSAVAKGLGPKFDKKWFFMVDLDKLWGWRDVPGGEKIWDKVLNWVHEIFTPTYKGSPDRKSVV